MAELKDEGKDEAEEDAEDAHTSAEAHGAVKGQGGSRALSGQLEETPEPPLLMAAAVLDPEPHIPDLACAGSHSWTARIP